MVLCIIKHETECSPRFALQISTLQIQILLRLNRPITARDCRLCYLKTSRLFLLANRSVTVRNNIFCFGQANPPPPPPSRHSADKPEAEAREIPKTSSAKGSRFRGAVGWAARGLFARQDLEHAGEELPNVPCCCGF